MPLTRTDFQQLADARAAEAAALLAAGLWDGAYYLAGYAVECALKACIAKMTVAESFPPPRKFVEQSYTHDLLQLVATAGLGKTRLADAIADPVFSANWDVAEAWDEASRYRRLSESAARQLYDAVTDPVHGVLSWVKRYW
jgi:hypothetical protein